MNGVVAEFAITNLVRPGDIGAVIGEINLRIVDAGNHGKRKS